MNWRWLDWLFVSLFIIILLTLATQRATNNMIIKNERLLLTIAKQLNRELIEIKKEEK